MADDDGLKREVGLWGLTSNIVNIVIGSGIFVLPAIVAEQLGAAGILAYLFCGFLITVIMLCFAEVGSKVTVAGGAYAYIEEAFGGYIGFVTTLLFVFGSSLMASAAVANALAQTAAYLVPAFSGYWARIAFLIFIYAGLAFINVRGVKRGIGLVKLTTLAKLIPLLLLLIFGAFQLKAQNLAWETNPTWDALGSVSLILFFAFQGAENSLSISGEVKQPNRVIPRAILLGFLIILVSYIALQLVAQGVLGSAFAQFKQAPLGEVARRVMGPLGVTLLSAGATVSMLGYLSSDSLSMPRVLFRAAKDGVLPFPKLAQVHSRFATPHVAIVCYAALGCTVAITGEFRQLAIYASSFALLIYLGVALSVIKLRRVRPAGSFQIPGGLTVPVVAVLTVGWFLSHLTGKEAMGVGAFLGAATLSYGVLRYVRRPKPPQDTEI